MIRFDHFWVSMLNTSICFSAVEDDLTEVGKDLPGAYGTGSDPEADDAYILMQFTGLHDKNGKEIYEGDILKANHTDLLTVVFENGSFCFVNNSNSGSDRLHQNRTEKLFVIGNIYENPELIP
jgi:hypothetical protein